MKELKVVEELCIGCGACIAIDGEHFVFNDMGLSEVISQNNLESDELVQSIESCPTNAIKLESDNKEEAPIINEELGEAAA